MAVACETGKFNAPTTLPNRSILSASKRDMCRKLLLSTDARKNELSSKLWSCERGSAFALLHNNCSPSEMLLQFQQYERLIRIQHAPIVSSFIEAIEERQSTRDIVSSGRWIKTISLPANGLCSRSTSTHSRRRAASDCMSYLALDGSLRSQRDQTNTQMSQREGSRLCLLQSRALESIMSTR